MRRFHPMTTGPGKKWRLKDVPPSGYVFLGGFLARLIVLVRLTESPFLLPAQGDMHFYNEWALRILRGEFTDYHAFYGLPLYPYLLAAIYKLFGYSPFVPGLVQACLEGGTATLIFLIAGRVFGDGLRRGWNSRGNVIGLLAAAGWALFLPAQAYSVVTMPTPWLVCIFWWLVWQIIKRTDVPSPLAIFLFGLLIGFAATGIATILFLLPLLVAALFLRWDSPWRFRYSRLAGVALLLVGVGVGTSPAWAHNRFVARDPVFLSAHSGVNFWIGNNPSANGYPHFPPGLHAGQRAMLADSIAGAEAAAGHPLKRSEVSAFWSAKAKAYITENPVAWVKLLLVKIANFWNAFQYDDLSIITSFREQGITLPGIRFGIVAALALPGIFFAIAAVPASRWILAAVLLHMVSLLSVFVTERYRLVVVPGLLLFAAFGLWELWRNCATGRHKRVLLHAVLLIAAMWVVSWRRGDTELWALDPYNSGLQALEAGHLEVAERKLSLAHAYVPRNAEVNFVLGNLALARKDPAAAKTWYAQTLELDSRHAGAFNNLGVLALEEGRAPEAIRLFELSLQIEPNDAKRHYLLARASLETGNAVRALAEMEVALRLAPTQPEFIELRNQIREKP